MIDARTELPKVVGAINMSVSKSAEGGNRTRIIYTLQVSTDSDSDTVHTPPSSPTQVAPEHDPQTEEDETQQATSAKTGAQTKVMAMDKDEVPYFQLPPEFTLGLVWSNHPGDLQLQTYFNPKKPHLGSDFGVEGLQPVLREMEGDYRFILTDSKGRFYLYEEWDGFLYWVKSRELEYMDTDVQKVDYIVCAIGDLDTERVFRGNHPADMETFANGVWVSA